MCLARKMSLTSIASIANSSDLSVCWESNCLSNAEEDAHTSNDQTIDGPDENICELSWATRNEIILILNEYSKFLLSQSIAERDQMKLTDRHFDLYQTLAILPHIGDSTESESSDEIVLELDFALKSKIVNSLLKNHSLAIVCARSVSSKLVEENNELLSSLLKLPVKMVKPAASCKSSRVEEAKNDLALSEGKHENRLMIWPEAFFSYEFSNVRAFLDEVSDTRLRSDFFYCRGKQFYIALYKTLANYTVKNLGIYVYVYVYAADGDVVNWHLDASFRICLLNQLSGGKDRARSRTNQRITKCKANQNGGVGISDFITPSDLMELGFLKDDKIVVQINFKAERLDRNG